MKYNNWILIGGTGRNIGKTTTVEEMIKNLSKAAPVVGVKVSNTFPGELSFHGAHKILFNENFMVFEEKNNSGNKDSMRFLRAGARKSYFIISKDEFIKEAFLHIKSLLNSDDIVICESNGLRKVMEPFLFVVIKGEKASNPKKNIDFILNSADVILPALNSVMLKKLAKRIQFKQGELIFLED